MSTKVPQLEISMNNANKETLQPKTTEINAEKTPNDLAANAVNGDKSTQPNLNTAELMKTYFKNYRKKVALKLAVGVILVILLVIELVSSSYIYQNIELPFLVYFQQFLNLNDPENASHALYYMQIVMNSSFSQIVVTGIMLCIFYGVDCIIGTKMILASQLCFSMTKVFTSIHQEPRPYWMDVGKNPSNTGVLIGYGCSKTFANPDMSLFILIFFWNYLQLCQKNSRIVPFNSDIKYLVLKVLVYFMQSVITIVRYMSADIFITQIGVLCVYNMFFLQILRIFDEKINKMIETSTIKSRRTNRYIINYFMAFLFLQIIDFTVFLSHDDMKYINVEYLKNFRKCISIFNIERPPVYQSEALGWFPTFAFNLSLVAMISAIMSISHTFIHIKVASFWLYPTKRERIFRVLLSLAIVLLCWMTELFRTFYQNDLDNYGIRSIYIEAFIVFCLFGIPLGVFPRFVFLKFHMKEKQRQYDERIKSKQLKDSENVADSQLDAVTQNDSGVVSGKVRTGTVIEHTEESLAPETKEFNFESHTQQHMEEEKKKGDSQFEPMNMSNNSFGSG